MNLRLWSWLHDGTIVSAEFLEDHVDLAIDITLHIGHATPLERIFVELHGVETFCVRDVVDGTTVELAPTGEWSFDILAEHGDGAALGITGDLRRPPDTRDVGELTATYRTEFVRLEDATRFTGEQFDDLLTRHWIDPW